MRSLISVLCALIFAAFGLASGSVIVNEIGPSSGQAGGFVELYNYGDDFQISGWTVEVELENGDSIYQTIDSPETTDMYLYTVMFPREALSSEGKDWRRVIVYDCCGDIVAEQDVPDVWISSFKSYSRVWTGELYDELECLGWGIRSSTPMEVNA